MKVSIKNKNEEGFTLVETLVAVMILVISVVTPLSIASQAMVYSAVARDQIIASNLAQEAIDFIRNERDRSAFVSTLGVSPARFDNFLDKFGVYTPGSTTYCYTTNGCAIDVQRSTYRGGAKGVNEIVLENDFTYTGTAHVIALDTCTTGNNCPYLRVNDLGDESSRTYTYGYVDASNTNWRESAFKRKVNMTVIGSTASPSEVRISVTVTWRTGSYDKSITMQEYIKSWPDGII